MPLEKLIAGFRTFHASYFKDSKHFDPLIKNGQTPETLVIACSDSRNDPALITDSAPGDIFVVRNVAAIVPPYQPDGQYHGTSAAIEFAVKGLKIKNIIVLGHALCGGVQALANPEAHRETYEFLTPWINIGAPAKNVVDRLLSDEPPALKQQALEQALILTSLNNLMTFPWVKEATDAGTLTLHGWYFDMVNGQLLNYDIAHGNFQPIHQAMHAPLSQKDSCCTPLSLEKLIKKHA